VSEATFWSKVVIGTHFLALVWKEGSQMC
jgi:hypothetical protein